MKCFGAASFLAVLCALLLACSATTLASPQSTSPGVPSTGNGGGAGTPTTGNGGGNTNSTGGASKNLVFSYYYWSADGIQPWDIDGNQISHLIWSFANIYKDGTVTLQGPAVSGQPDYAKMATSQVMGFRDQGKCGCSGTCLTGQLYQMFLLKQKYPHLKVLLSVGGWVWSDNFSDAFNDPKARDRAVQTSFDLMQKYGFDGLDIDWEFPATDKDKTAYPNWTNRPNDHDNLAAFLEGAKAYWAKNQRPELLLTAATPGFIFAGSDQAWSKINAALDYVLMMGYEYQHTQLRTRSGSSLKTAQGDNKEEIANNLIAGIDTYKKKGVSMDKFVVGIPLYAVGWSGLPDGAQGRDGIAGNGVQISGSMKVAEPTAYNTLMKQFARDKAWKGQYDSAHGTMVYSNGQAVWFMESVESVQDKAKYVQQQNLAGIMLWNSNQDLPDKNSLVGAISNAYKVNTNQDKRPQAFCFDSKDFCNLRCDYKPVAGAIGAEQVGKPGSKTSTIGSDAAALRPQSLLAGALAIVFALFY